MSFARPTNFYIEVQQGNLAGYSIIHKFGRNNAVPNGNWALVSPMTPSGAMPSSGSTVRIKAGGNAADTAAGVGAREITVLGIDTSLQEVSETIVTSGANASATTTTVFWRLYRAYTTAVGTYGGGNVDDVIVENADGIDERLCICIDEGQTQHGAYSIPSGKIGYLLSIHMTADATKAADFRVFIRNNFTDVQAPVSSKQLKLYFDGVLGEVNYKPISPGLVLEALSDIWIEARGGGAGTEVSVDFEILLIDDPSGPIRAM